MIRIECDVWEQRQLFEYLEYSKNKLIEDCNNGTITDKYLEIELDKIENLRKVLNGNGKSDYLLRSSVFRSEHSDESSLTPAEKEILKLPFVR